MRRRCQRLHRVKFTFAHALNYDDVAAFEAVLGVTPQGWIQDGFTVEKSHECVPKTRCNGPSGRTQQLTDAVHVPHQALGDADVARPTTNSERRSRASPKRACLY